MRIICIEEHAIDLDIAKAAQPALQREAPYIGLQSSVPRPRLKDRPSAVTMQEAVAPEVHVLAALPARHSTAKFAQIAYQRELRVP
jgi:hypothetical protein